jgi:hypothetical protein
LAVKAQLKAAGGKSLVKDLADLPPTIIPMMVSALFSTELLMKAVIVHEKSGAFPKPVHTLSELFAAISSAGRSHIERLFKLALDKDAVSKRMRDASANPSEWELMPLLQRHDRAFELVRYGYELAGDWEFQSLTPIRNAIFSYIFGINPSWKAAFDKVGLPPT